MQLKVEKQKGGINIEQLSLREKISYGCGDLGLCLITTVMSTFLMFFYTDIAGISLGSIGLIMMIGSLFDAVSDPLMGFIVDKTNSKWGKCRPYLLFAPIFVLGAAFLVFNVPQDASEGSKFIYALITYIAYNLSYTAFNVPYQTMMASITDNQNDRLSISMFKTLGSSSSQFFINAFALSIVAMLGKGSNYHGYRRAILVLGSIGVVFMIICFANTKERIVPPKSEKISFKDNLRAFKNLPWAITCLTTLILITVAVMRAQQTMYYAQYVLQDMSIASKLLAIPSAISVIVAMVTPKVAVKFGKRNVVIGGVTIAILGTIGVWLSGQNINMIFICSIIAAVGSALPVGVGYVMSAEAIDYGEWKNGKRVQGILMAFVGFGVKVGLSVSSLISTSVLNAGGYESNMAVQSQSAITAITINYIWIPVMFYAVIIVANLFYKLDSMYPQIREELENRRKGIA